MFGLGVAINMDDINHMTLHAAACNVMVKTFSPWEGELEEAAEIFCNINGGGTVDEVINETHTLEAQCAFVKKCVAHEQLPEPVIRAIAILVFRKYNAIEPKVLRPTRVIKKEFGKDIVNIIVFTINDEYILVFDHENGGPEVVVQTKDYFYEVPLINNYNGAPSVLVDVSNLVCEYYTEIEEDDGDEIEYEKEERVILEESPIISAFCKALHGQSFPYIRKELIFELFEAKLLKNNKSFEENASMLEALFPLTGQKFTKEEIIEATNNKTVQYFYTKRALEIHTKDSGAGSFWYFPRSWVENYRKLIFTDEGEFLKKSAGGYIDDGSRFRFPGSYVIWKVGGALRLAIYEDENKKDIIHGGYVIYVDKDRYNNLRGFDKVLSNRVKSIRERCRPIYDGDIYMKYELKPE